MYVPIATSIVEKEKEKRKKRRKKISDFFLPVTSALFIVLLSINCVATFRFFAILVGVLSCKQITAYASRDTESVRMSPVRSGITK